MSEFIAPENTRRLVKVIGRTDPGEVLGQVATFGGRTINITPLAIRFPLDGLCAYYDEDSVKPWTEDPQ
ncbi:hypothetical protein [Arthrobacter sp. NPDC058192]|uniref:hypothetical protein n=1 Tax=Arthrobacter sp. NPDC058192 TaxID=3346372 RepID=UPI0036EB2B10